MLLKWKISLLKKIPIILTSYTIQGELLYILFYYMQIFHIKNMQAYKKQYIKKEQATPTTRDKMSWLNYCFKA